MNSTSSSEEEAEIVAQRTAIANQSNQSKKYRFINKNSSNQNINNSGITDSCFQTVVKCLKQFIILGYGLIGDTSTCSDRQV